MKYILPILLVGTLLPIFSRAQNIEAKYKVTSVISIPTGDGATKDVSVSLSATLYRKNNKYIYFEIPDYLSKLTNGVLPVSNSNNNYVSITLNADSVQNIYYTDYDSLIVRKRSELSAQPGKNYLDTLDPGDNKWKLLPDAKEVNGLHCQKAQLTVNGQEQWLVWFCTDIPMQSGVSFLKGLPGLVVEAEWIPVKRSYILESYTVDLPIEKNVFWPDVFNEPFARVNKGSKTGAGQKKIQKQLELEKL